MSKWAVLWKHRFGQDLLFIEYESEDNYAAPSEEEIVAQLGDLHNFELDRDDEWLDLFAMNDGIEEWHTVRQFKMTQEDGNDTRSVLAGNH